MRSKMVNRVIDRGARRVPGLRRLPMLRLLALGEVVLLAQEHLGKLDPPERRRLVELVRRGHGRRRNLSESEQEELSRLLAKAEPRAFAAHAAEKLSPVPIPQLVVRRLVRR